MGIRLVKSDKCRIGAGFNPTPVLRRSVEAKCNRPQSLREDVTILWALKTQSKVRFMSLQTNRPKVGSQIDIDPWIASTQVGETRSEKML